MTGACGSTSPGLFFFGGGVGFYGCYKRRWGLLFPAGVGAKENTLRKKIEKSVCDIWKYKNVLYVCTFKIIHYWRGVSVFTYSVVGCVLTIFHNSLIIN